MLPEVIASLFQSLKVLASTSSRDGSPPDAAEVEDFIHQWRLTSPGILCLRRLPSKPLGVTIRTFAATSDLAFFDGVFVDYAMSLAKAWQKGAILDVPELRAFMTHYSFDEDSRKTLAELPPQLIGLVVRSFAPESEESTWNAKFIEHAVSMERAWRNLGFDTYRAAVHVVLSPGKPSTRRRATRQDCGTVVVMGLHNSGTHALVEYLNAYFHVDVQPLIAPKKMASSASAPSTCGCRRFNCSRVPRADR